MLPILACQREFSCRLVRRSCAVDQRIQNFLDSYLKGAVEIPQPPHSTFVLDQPGLARVLSLPTDSTSFAPGYVESYKVLGGALHNPRNDHRTTAGVFHVAEGSLPTPDDEIAVDRDIFTRLLAHMVDASDGLLTLSWASTHVEPARYFISLLLRPIVIPEVPGLPAERLMEIHFTAPDGLASNLNFVKGVFGNGGDPYLPENDASLAPESQTGHTSYVIPAPHLMKLTKEELNLPSWEDATERQRHGGQYWEDENELYNGGRTFRCVARDERGVIVTVVADNYFGYCKKGVKTQIGYSVNLLGCAEEEYANGAIAYPRHNLGQEFTDVHTPEGLTPKHAVESNPSRFEMRGDDSTVTAEDPTVALVPGGVRYSVRSQTIAWT